MNASDRGPSEEEADRLRAAPNPVSEQHDAGLLNATPGMVSELRDAGLLSPEARARALEYLSRDEKPLAWFAWFQRIVLVIGAALVLAGVITFFAFNWARMPVWGKFGLIEACMLAVLLAAWRKGLDTLTGKILLTSAGVLVGVFLAVFGQVYQTGADAYELFQGWLLLIAVWVFISRFPAFWIFWVALIHTWLILYFDQVVYPRADQEPIALCCILLAVANIAMLTFHEAGRLKRVAWLEARWPQWIYLMAGLTCLIIPTCHLIMEPDDRTASSIPAVALFVLFTAAAIAYFRLRTPDLFAITLCTLAVCINVLTFIGKLVFEASDSAGSFLFFGIIVLGVFSAASVLLVNTAKKMTAEEERHA